MQANGYRYEIRGGALELICSQSEPEGGHLKRGFLVYPGGCEIGSSEVQEVYQQEISGLPVITLGADKPAAKSSTNVTAATTTCRTCGCRKGPKTGPKQNCVCNCH